MALRSTVLAGVLLIASSSSAAAQSFDFQRSFPAGPVVTIDVTTIRGKITVRTATKVAVDGLKKKKVVRVSEKRYSLVAGSKKQVSLKLTKTARALVADGRLKVKSVATARGGDRVVTTFSLKSAKG